MAETEIKLGSKLYTLVVIFLVGLFLFWGLSAWQTYKQDPNNFPREISVDAVGKASYVPDIAKIRLGVNTIGQTSEAVVEENTAKVNAIMEVLKAQGIEEKDIQTLDFFLNPNWQWSEDRGSYQDGFILDQTLEVTVREFEKIGDVIAAVTKEEIGANMVGGVNFDIDDTADLKSIARKEAITEAKQKAKEIAEASGLKLGDIVGYYEYEEPIYGKGAFMEAAETRMAEDTALSPQIEPGEEELKLTVSLTYRLK